MSEVKRFRADHRHVVETEFDDAQFVGVADFDRVTAERDAALKSLDSADASAQTLHEVITRLQQRLTAADERADVLKGLLREAQKSARKQDWASGYPTLFTSVDAALKPAEGGGDERPAGCCCPPKGHKGIWAAAMCPIHHGLKARTSLHPENQRITPAPFKCLACGEYHEGSGNLPCPNMSPYSRIEP